MASNELMAAYIAQLSPQEQKVLAIAREHLESSFSLTKSIGFQEWLRGLPPSPPIENVLGGVTLSPPIENVLKGGITPL